ncbi:ABC transporter substrate-binding protein [Occultella gossypii]|uniref:Extracellular solute-binding protein n=1 Tax=Occultella gossypii TaxID=2800820 RepID=A0ABS7S6Z8_9MICO|nr:extracellular solute-binding protein [Occultella gossypii]MBZ2194963.1 extracellular solute-binding protein [Occultella gossypii]
MQSRSKVLGAAIVAVLLVVGGAIWFTSRPAGDTESIEWWVPNWDEEAAAELAAQYEEESGVQIDIVQTTNETLPNRVSTALDSGTTPDVIIELASRINRYAVDGTVSDLGDMFGSELPEDDFIDGALEEVSSDGSIYAVPYRWDCIALIYNPEMLDAAGVEVPTTWDEYVTAAQALTVDGRSGTAWPLGHDGNAALRYLGLAVDGGSAITNGTPSLSTDSSSRAIDVIGGTIRDGWASPSSLEVDNTGVRQLFENEQIAMYVGGLFDVAPLQEAGIPVATAVSPGTQIADGWAYMVPTEAPNADAARDFVAFLSTPENMAALTESFPARISAADDERFTGPDAAAHLEQLTTNSVPAPSDPAWGELVPDVYAALQSVALGQTDAAAAAAALDERAQATLGGS